MRQLSTRARALLALAAVPALAAWAACDASSSPNADAADAVDAGAGDSSVAPPEPWSCQGCHTNAALLQDVAAVVNPPVDKPEDTGDG